MVNRRCTVDLAAPKHGGDARYAHLDTSTYTIAENMSSSAMFRVPPPCGRTPEGGNNGRTTSHNPSGTIHDQRPATTLDTVLGCPFPPMERGCGRAQFRGRGHITLSLF
ncbi:hypothetical protein Acsp05_72490 [Actinokineospora sp. NBRC 105648]|nr:hypothetical protein Acsp05_72490 [Actinokineospora sp. NBRC 105648]